MLAVPDAKKYFEKADFVVTESVRGDILTADKESRASLSLTNVR